MHKRTIRSVIAFYAFVAVMIGMAATPAAHGEGSHQPYGGCDEAWQAPHSTGADACRDHGWTITSRLVVGPHGVVRGSSLPPCGVELPCMSTGHGPRFWVDRQQHGHYVWATYPVVNRWHWVGPDLAARTHTSRRCVVRFGDTTTIRCPDGRTVTS